MQIRQESYQEHLGTIKGELDIFDNALMDHQIWVCEYEMGTKGQSQVLRRQVYREKAAKSRSKTRSFRLSKYCVLLIAAD